MARKYTVKIICCVKREKDIIIHFPSLIHFIPQGQPTGKAYLCTPRTKLLPACMSSSCACPCVKLLIGWSFNLTMTSPTFKPIHSAKLPSVTYRSFLYMYISLKFFFEIYLQIFCYNVSRFAQSIHLNLVFYILLASIKDRESYDNVIYLKWN